jgi:hypothetical protein
MRCTGLVAQMGRMEMDLGYQKTRSKNTTTKTRCRWVDTNMMDLREIGWSSMDWTDLTQD